MSTRKRAATPKKHAPSSRTRRHRSRPTPKWIKAQEDLDEVGRRRCLLLLSVLSGECPLTDAIASEQISRQMYYQMEERALRAMLGALTPGSGDEMASRGESAAKRIAELEKKVARLERDKRRGERLPLLTRKVIRGPIKTAAGRPRRTDGKPSSTKGGHTPSRASKTTKGTTAAAAPTPSTPTPAGEGAPRAGSAS